MRRHIKGDVMPEETGDIESIIFSTPESERANELDAKYGYTDD
jgi:hypothetical protein